MDTSNRKIKAKAAFLVDFDTFSYNKLVQQWLNKKVTGQPNAELVFLVSDPEHNDYDPEDDDRFAEYFPELCPLVVLRNTGHIMDVAFKTTAAVLIHDTGQLIPVVGIDEDFDILDMYQASGMMFAFAPTDLLGIN